MKITRITGTFPSTSGLCRCRYYMFIPENPRAAVMLSHGMCEYFLRYRGLAEFLCKNGIALVGNDHIGGAFRGHRPPRRPGNAPGA